MCLFQTNNHVNNNVAPPPAPGVSWFCFFIFPDLWCISLIFPDLWCFSLIFPDLWCFYSYISRPLMYFSYISRPLMFFSYISRPLTYFSYISRPLMIFSYISRPLMFFSLSHSTVSSCWWDVKFHLFVCCVDGASEEAAYNRCVRPDDGLLDPPISIHPRHWSVQLFASKFTILQTLASVEELWSFHCPRDNY